MSLFLNRSNPIPPHPPLTKGGLRGGGFTLIEILVSVTILSIVLAAIYSTFFLTHKAVTGMDETMLKIQEARRAIDILKRELDSVYYSNDENTFLKVQDRDIHGRQATQISFTAFSLLRPGLSRISYYVEDKDGKLTLFKKTESPYFNENNPPSPAFNSPLSKGGYRGVKGGLGGFSEEETEGCDIIEDMESFTVEAKYDDKWVKIWDTEINNTIPDEIRISLSFKMKDRLITLFDVSRPKIGRSI
ncbi:MAG: type II secretion system protein [Nitrospirae bacterium]|jgi:prepilin-type N-terminal cleavage/methylation domain-containing protein|nr:type II secretion system protein [Nitrospirota bacterium]